MRNRIEFEIGQQIKNFIILSDIPQIKKREQKRGTVLFWFVRCKCGKEYWMSTTRLNNKNKYYECQQCCQGAIGTNSKTWKGFGEISRKYISRIKHNAKMDNKKYNLSDEYLWELFLKQNRKCAYTGKILVFGNCNNTKRKTTKPRPTTASLDRIDSNKGYVEGNVQWIHKDVNKMKTDFTHEKFIQLCKEITENNVK